MADQNWFNTPLLPQSAVQGLQDSLTQPKLDQSPTMARIKGFGAGALEGLRNLTSPESLVSLGSLLAPVAGGAMTGESFDPPSSGPISDPFGLNPSMSRREFFDRLSSNPTRRAATYLKDAGPKMYNRSDEILANQGYMEKVPAREVGYQWSSKTGKIPRMSEYKATPKLDQLPIEDFVKVLEDSRTQAEQEFPLIPKLGEQRGYWTNAFGDLIKDQPEDTVSGGFNWLSNLLKRYGTGNE